MQDRMLEILKSKDSRCLVGIPRIYDRTDWPTPEKAAFWQRYARSEVLSLYSKKKQYGSAFITRPDAVKEIDNADFFKLVQKIWTGRRVVVVLGEGTGFLKKIGIIDGCSSHIIIYGPKENAFSVYKELYRTVRELTTPDDVIILSLGATATVMAYDLSLDDRQALDLGHMGQFYNRTHPKATPLALND